MNKPVKTSSVLELSMTEVASAIRKGDVSSYEVTKASLDAFAAKDGIVNSAIWLEREAALETAEAYDKLRKAGKILGPLHGVPLAHKDMYYKAGKLSTCGSGIRKDFRPDYTATVIEKLEAAGSITLGGLNMAEFAQNPTGHNKHFGHCHNPGTRITARVAPPPARAQQSRHGSFMARWVRIRVARSASPLPSAA